MQLEISIYEEIKDMSPSEETAYFNAQAEEAKEKYNFRVVNLPCWFILDFLHQRKTTPQSL